MPDRTNPEVADRGGRRPDPPGSGMTWTFLAPEFIITLPDDSFLPVQE